MLHKGLVEADLTAVADLVSSAPGFGAAQSKPAAEPALPAAVLPVHLPKQILSQPHLYQLPCHLPHQLPSYLLHQPPCHLPRQLPRIKLAPNCVLVWSAPLSGPLQKRLQLQTVS